MRPDEIVHVLTTTKLRPNVDGQLTNADELHPQLDRLQKVPGFGDIVANLRGVIASLRMKPSDTVAKQMGDLVNQYHVHRAFLLNFFGGWTGTDPENVVYVGMPNSAMTSPAEFSRAFDDLVKGLDELVLRVTGETLKVEGVRPGSDWLMLSGGPAALSFIYGLARLFFWIRARLADEEHRQVELREAGARVEVIEALAEGTRVVIRKQVEELAKRHSRKGLDEGQRNENATHAMNLLNTYTKHMQDGARISISAAAPSSVKEQLPIECGGTQPELPATAQIEQLALPEPSGSE